VVLTADKPPQAIAGLEQRLRSRFEGGLSVDVRPPTTETRLQILHNKAKAQNVCLPDGVAEMVSRCSGSSVRELEGALNRVIAYTSTLQIALTPDTVVSVLAATRPRPSRTIEEVQALVARRLQVRKEDLPAHDRTKALAFARQLAMYLSRTVLETPYSSIAKAFGGRDHTTVIYAVRTIERKREGDASVAHLVDQLERELRG
jgi:chromosomal replication initiator protein